MKQKHIIVKPETHKKFKLLADILGMKHDTLASQLVDEKLKEIMK